MNVKFTETAWSDLMYWLDNDLTIVHKISALINSIKRTPTKGIGKH